MRAAAVVRTATTGGRPAAQHAAINPPQPRLSSSGCGASTRHVPDPATSSRVPVGSARHCACRSLTFNVGHPAAGERRNAPPPRSAPHQAPAGADRSRDRGKSARPASHGGTPPGQANAAPAAWHQDTRSRRRCAPGPCRRQPSRVGMRILSNACRLPYPQAAGLAGDHGAAEPRLLMGIINAPLSAQGLGRKVDQAAQSARRDSRTTPGASREIRLP